MSSDTERPSRSNTVTPAGAHKDAASLKTIAKHLGLSAATVSRVLSGASAAKSIPETTQQRIFEAAKTLNYRPNLLARSLRSQRSLTVGVLVAEVSAGYIAMVVSGIEQRLMKAGYFYFLVSHHHRPEAVEQCQQMLLSRAVEGLIAIDTPLTHRAAVPTITVSGHHDLEGVANIALDHARAAELAIGHLHGLGHTSIAFIKGQTFSADTEERWRAIRLAMAAHGMRINPALVSRLEGEEPTHEPGYIAARKLLAAGTRFTALFAFNDTSAIGAIRALREAGLHVPQDVSVVGFDDVESAAYQNPALTTVRQPLHTMGVLAAEQVLLQITSGGPLTVQQIVIAPEFVVRESTAHVNKGH